MNPAGRTQPCSTWNIESEEGDWRRFRSRRGNDDGMGARTLTGAKRPTGESDQETDEVGSSVTGSASHRSIADSAAAVTITPPGQTSGANSSMVSAGSPGVGPPRHRGCHARRHHAQFVASSMRNLHPISNAEGVRATGVVEAPFRGVHETKFRMGEERRQNHSGKPAPVPTSTMRPWNSSNDAENDEHTAGQTRPCVRQAPQRAPYQ